MPKHRHYPKYILQCHSFAFFQLKKALAVLIFSTLFSISFLTDLSSQTILDPGDVAIIGVNANNNACSGYSGQGEDVISFVAFKDITNNTEIDFTDNGWERVMANRFGDSEGTNRFVRNGGTISAGSTFTLIFRSSLAEVQTQNPGWTVSDLNLPSAGSTNINMASSGDQLLVMQGGIWDNMGSTGNHDAIYSGDVLYGFNTRTFWAADGTSQQSNLHPDIDPCFHMEPTGGTTNYISYSGPTSAATQLEWISRIGDVFNWSSYPNCASYVPPPPFLPISNSGMSIDCSVCNGCGNVTTDLTFNLPPSGGPFIVVYTDGTNNFTLNGIDDGHIETVTVNSTTTFQLVSVTDINSCPVYSNFEGDATITISGNGGNASISGGGVICTGNCSEITFTITGGQAPYEVEFLLAIGSFNIPFTIPVPNTNFTINICSGDVLIPVYDFNTNTLTLPDFIVSTGSITLLSMTDDSNCQGTVDSNPVSIDIYETPEAFAAGPLSACDDGNGQAIFDLTSLDNTVNGNSGNPVDWFLDQQTNNPINNPSNFQSGSTTVYATVSTSQCTSEPVAIDLLVEPIPTANPASDEACGVNGQATFDLTTLDATVNGNSGDPVNWYSDINGNSPIPNPSNYTTSGGIVYAAVSNGSCESVPVMVTLTVIDSPVAFPTNDELCDDGSGTATFNLTNLDIIVNGGSGDPVSWYADPNALNPIPNPSNFVTTGSVVYALVSNGVCESNIVEIVLTVLPSPTANPTSATGCDDGNGLATFDLTELDVIVNGNSGNPVNWFLDAGTIPIPDPENFMTPGGVIFANVENGVCTSPFVEILLIVIDAPTAIPTSDSACDEGNGTATFDLTTLDNIVNDGTNNSVIWYLDINGTSPIPTPSNYISGNGSVYAQVDVGGGCNSPIVEIILTVTPAPTASPATATECEEIPGQATFDLTTLDNTVNGGSGNPVSWFLDSNGTTPIPNPDNYQSGSGVVYAIVNDGSCNSPAAEITLIVIAAPNANPAAAEACEDSPGQAIFDLTILDNTVNGGSGDPVSWFTDNNAIIPVPDPFNFESSTGSVFAIVDNGVCSSQIVEILLTVHPIPEANTTSADECDDGNGTASFNLTALESTVNGGNTNIVNWYQDDIATIPIVSPYITGSTTIYATVDNGNCVSEIVEIILNVGDSPQAFPAAADGCDDGNGTATFDLTALESTVNGGTANTVNWFEDDAGTIPISSPYTTGPTTIYATVGEGNCVSEIVEITLNVVDSPEAFTATAEECDDGNGAATFDLTALESAVNGGNSNTVNWFEDDAATIPISSPYTSGSTTIYATVGEGNCVSEIVEITLNVLDLPIANSTSTDECDDGNGTATFDLTSLESTVNGGNSNIVNWFEDNAGTNPIGSPYITGSTTIYANVDDGNCISELVEITLNIVDSPEAFTATADECGDGNEEATFDLSALESVVNGGTANIVNWFEDDQGTIPISSPFTTGSTIVYASVGDGNCISGLVEITLNVIDIPEANSSSANECDDGNGTATFNLTALESTINGGTTNTVNWFEDDAATIPISSPYTTGSTIVYAIVGDGNCISETVEIQLNVGQNPDSAPASTSECDEGNGTATFDLSTLESIINGGTANPVNWFEDVTVTIPISSPYISSSTTVYANVGSGNCLSSTVGVQLNVLDNPMASPTSADECDDGNGTATFDLSALESVVNGGTANIVNWFEDDAGTIPISSPYTSGSTTIYANIDDGICTSPIVEIDLNILNSPAANSTFAEECDDGNGTAIFNLTNLESTVNGGTANSVNWFEDMAGTIPISSPYTSAQTTIYANVDDGNCISQLVEINLNIVAAPEANPTFAEECDDGNGTAIFNLTNLESTVNGGTTNSVNWFEDMAGTIQISSPYTSAQTTIYANVDNGFCLSQLVEIQLNVVNSPEAFPAVANACDDGTGVAVFDLNLLESTINGGTANNVNWFEDLAATIPISSPYSSPQTTVYANVGNGNCISPIVAIDLNILTNPTFDYSDLLCEDENVIINGTIYDINNPSGTETLSNGASNGCDSIVNVELDFYEPVLGTINGPNTICDGQSVDLTFDLDGANLYDIIYSDGINPDVQLDGINDGHTITVFPTATTTYTLISVAGNGVPCSPTLATSSVTVTLTSIGLDVNLLTDYQGFSVSCNGESDGEAEAVPLSGTAPFSFQWSNGSTAAIATNLSAENYTVTITDDTGCTAEGSVSLTEPTAIEATVQTTSPDCNDFVNGSIIIENVIGGAGIYEYSLDGVFFNLITSFPVEIPLLPSGSYELFIQDINDCAIVENVVIQEPVSHLVNLGSDVEIILGDSIRLFADANFDVSEIIWNPEEYLSCFNCLDPFAIPFETTTYSVVVFDSLGCSATDEVTISVKKSRNVFIPTAFSPNGDGTNDEFFVFAGSSAVAINRFTIFSRWGEVVYNVNDILPNDRSASWNGQFNGEPLNPGVFVYLIEIEFADGKVFTYKGDVTLMK